MVPAATTASAAAGDSGKTGVVCSGSGYGDGGGVCSPSDDDGDDDDVGCR
ncbi:hypothetical protein Hdeb2414_s0005g00160551 [Helianthus debilis subsp. tardiflorus]